MNASPTPLSNPLDNEQADLSEMIELNEQICRLFDRKSVLAARLSARYSPGLVAKSESAKANESKDSGVDYPNFDDVRQQAAFAYLLMIEGRSVMKPMAAFVQSRGFDLGDSTKPGARLSPLLRKRPDVFGYDEKTEEYYLVSDKWRRPGSSQTDAPVGVRHYENVVSGSIDNKAAGQSGATDADAALLF